jgi:N-dimethylarginine dimethylaminohydrolase
MPAVLMCPPKYFDVVDQKNPYMLREHMVDRVKARTQWENLRCVLQQNGCEIKTIDPVQGLEDMVFAANQTFVGEKAGYGKFALPSRMLHPSRQREVPFYTEWFRSQDFRIIDIAFADDYLEGHGDLLWHPGGLRIYAGYGFRSTRGGVDKFSAAMSEMGISVIPLELIDHYCYHLDTCLCPLNDEAALIFAGAFSAEALASIHKYWKRIHLLDAEEAHHFVGNGIVVNGRYITPHVTSQLESTLHREGLIPTPVETSEFEKSGGSCACMTTLLP